MKLEKNEYFKTYYDPIFYVSLEVLVCSNERANLFLKNKNYRYEISKHFVAATICLDKNNLTKYVIWLEKFDFFSISHELIHLVKWVCQNCGVPFNVDNDEFIAYYHGFWLKRLCEDVEKFKKLAPEKNNKLTT